MKSAKDIIGDQAADDYVLRPEVHADSLPPEAGALARILRSSAIQELVGRYRAADSAAIRLQNTYKRLAAIALVLQSVAVFFGALFIIQLPEHFGWILQTLPVDGLKPGKLTLANLLTGAELICALVAAIAGTAIGLFKPFEKWNMARAKAEAARINFFSAVIEAREAPLPNEVPQLPLVLEYFRRYQLETEINYYTRRTNEHAKSAERIVSILAVLGYALFFISGLSAYGLFLSLYHAQIGLNPEENRLLAFVGAISAAAATALNNWLLIVQHQRNAARYETTARNLKTLRNSYLEGAREAAARNEDDGVRSFVAAVNEQISVEHRVWLLLQEHLDRPDLGGLGIPKLPKLRAQGSPFKG